MEHFKQFFKQKGLYLACLAVVFAATAAGVLALRSILNHVVELANTVQEEAPWQDDTTVNKPDTTQPEPARTPAPASSASPSPDAASSAPAASPAPAASAAPSGSAGGSPGFWRGKVLAPYSGDELVYNATLGDWRTHNGVDYACAQDAQVCAPAAGKVTAVDTDGRWGSVVCIEDSAGRIWRVCGTADPAVHTGDEVSVGQALGRAGSIPNECAEETHIHLEVMQGDTYLDPAKLLG